VGILESLKHQVIGRPYKMQEADFQELRGQVLYAIGETEIRISRLERGEARDEMGDLRLQALWRDIVESLRRLSKRDELAGCCQQYADVCDRPGLELDDFVALTNSYLEEIREVGNRGGFELGEDNA